MGEGFFDIEKELEDFKKRLREESIKELEDRIEHHADMIYNKLHPKLSELEEKLNIHVDHFHGDQHYQHHKNLESVLKSICRAYYEGSILGSHENSNAIKIIKEYIEKGAGGNPNDKTSPFAPLKVLMNMSKPTTDAPAEGNFGEWVEFFELEKELDNTVSKEQKQKLIRFMKKILSSDMNKFVKEVEKYKNYDAFQIRIDLEEWDDIKEKLQLK